MIAKYYVQYKKRKSQDSTNIHSQNNRNVKNNFQIMDSLEGAN